jgi:hypothetical protein
MSNLGVNFDRLHTAVDWSIRQLETPRKNRVTAIRQYVGSHYADGGADKRVPTNFLELAITIYTRQLAARAPRAMITAAQPALRPAALNMELALNQIPEEIGLGSTLRRAVIEAMFAFGVVKVGLAQSGATVLGHDYGEPFADLVPLDSYVLDMSAKTRGAIEFEGDEYWLPVEDVRAMYNDQKIEPDPHTNIGEQGQERAESVSTDEAASVFSEKVWLRDIYIARTHKLVTYAVKSKKVLKVIDWEGPHTGPYHVLGFSDVPGNLLPLPPVALWLDLHELGNALFRKLGRQADSKKTVAAFSGGNDEDVESLKRAQDGEGIRYNGQRPESITVGGIDAPTLAFYLQVRDLFSYFGGNLDALGGLSPMADTVGQERLVSDAASSRLKQMGETTIDFARGIFRDLAWYAWTDPVRERPITKVLRGTDISIQRKWTQADRQGRFMDYALDIDVYSMQDDSPSSKLQKIGMALERFVFPMLPLVQQQGGQIDFKMLIDMIAQLSNVPELSDIVRFVDPEQLVPVEGTDAGAGKPATTTRRYERVSRSGASRQGRDDVLSRLLMGGKVPGAEGASLSRRAS